MTNLSIASPIDPKTDPLAMAISQIAKAMKLDYGTQYIKLYAKNEDLQAYRRRLYNLCTNTAPIDITTGYSDYLKSGSPFCPSIQNLLVFIDNAKKARLKIERNKEESVRVSALPAPTITCNPVEMFTAAKVENESYTPEEAKERHKMLLINHDAMLKLNAHKIYTRYASDQQSCSYDGCRKSGAISNGTKGEGNFYCKDHFRQVA
jgi:hypothetical protein